ncbi:hypothetical protein K3172_13020 [Qipengyuania sp. 6B39]|uniref:hypothetical protein n=1 Tax=Qipengyuania proteolytica TaxID=2867239 RepID=UPI001C896744|nr:hypothetical protein [Qipengyuania proteolytica]MBX7496781.1 hypothetical protein [Qipengyuania proteolytica]
MSYNAKPWLRRVALASVAGMSDQEVSERGFGIMLDAMRSAYCARHPDSKMALSRREARQGRPAAADSSAKPSSADAERPAFEGESK